MTIDQFFKMLTSQMGVPPCYTYDRKGDHTQYNFHWYRRARVVEARVELLGGKSIVTSYVERLRVVAA